ncbi:MAG: calcium/proton exchanger [Anaerolineae bacterium]
MRYLNILLIFIPIAIVADFLGWDPTIVFITSALGMVPLAGLLGEATEELTLHTGPDVGGLLNATLGNFAELIISIVAIRAGLLELVKASITGSILGNILLILGLSILLGGLRHGLQTFHQRRAGLSATMMTLAIIGLAIPAIFSHAIEVQEGHQAVEYLSIGVAGVMIVIYVLSLIYSFFSEKEASIAATEHEVEQRWSVSVASLILIGSAAFIAWLSEILVGAVEPVVASLGVTEFFIGIIVVPLVGNVAEHLVAVQVAVKNEMDLSLAVSLGSSMQIALFVAPLLVFVSLLMGNPMDLVFNQFELAALGAAVVIAALISLDGESNWLEGAQLLAVYAIIALAFFFLPINQ